MFGQVNFFRFLKKIWNGNKNKLEKFENF
jgi:hypothetical protein